MTKDLIQTNKKMHWMVLLLSAICGIAAVWLIVYQNGGIFTYYGDYNCQQNSQWLQLAAEGVYKPADIILGNDSEQHIDHIFVNTDQVELVEHRFLNDRIVQEDGEHRYSDHDPVFVTVKIKE